MFSEFLDHVDAAEGPALVERMLADLALPSGGAYTGVGRYDHREFLAMLDWLARETGRPVADLARRYGRHLFARLADRHADLVRPDGDLFAFLRSVDDHIHVEVHKLYPGAELPRLRTRREADGRLVLDYVSTRPLADLCEGLIEGAVRHFGAGARVIRTDRTTEHGAAARFEIVAG